MQFTILGSSGFIGRHVKAALEAAGHAVHCPAREVQSLKGETLGHVIYAIGMTGNHRQHPQQAHEAHVTQLQRLMDGARYDSWLYLSSTRMYGLLPPAAAADEQATIPCPPEADAFDRSKLAGEAFCLAQPNSRVVRLSNVYGAGQSVHTFLGSILADLLAAGRVVIGESPTSSKDYIAIADVVALLPQIALHGTQRLYNVASGLVTTHQQLADTLRASGYTVDFADGGPTRRFPRIDNQRLLSEFPYMFRQITDDLPHLLPKVVAHG